MWPEGRDQRQPQHRLSSSRELGDYFQVAQKDLLARGTASCGRADSFGVVRDSACESPTVYERRAGDSKRPTSGDRYTQRRYWRVIAGAK